MRGPTVAAPSIARRSRRFHVAFGLLLLSTLGISLPYIQQLGVENIQRHRQPMIDRLQEEEEEETQPETPGGADQRAGGALLDPDRAVGLQ